MPIHKTITFDADGFRLTGTLHLPDAPLPPLIIGCHGLLADRRSPKQIALARACANAGMAYLRFDHRGCGDSQGDFDADTSLDARCQDLYHAMQTMQGFPGIGKERGLFGSSFGGTVVLAFAAQYPVTAMATYAAPVNSSDIKASVIQDLDNQLAPSPGLSQALNFDISDRLHQARNILVVHGQCDEIVPLDHGRLIHQKAAPPKELVIQKSGDHRMSDPAHQADFQKRLVDWFMRFFKLQAIARCQDKIGRFKPHEI